MDGVAPKVAQEIPVLFEHDSLYSRACEQETQHHPGWAAANNATPGRNLFHVIAVCRLPKFAALATLLARLRRAAQTNSYPSE
jgi:hypothetical protein